MVVNPDGTAKTAFPDWEAPMALDYVLFEHSNLPSQSVDLRAAGEMTVRYSFPWRHDLTS